MKMLNIYPKSLIGGNINMNGRIEVYIHSDNTTENKGAAMVKVITETKFALKSKEFKRFTKELAKLSYASGKTDFILICEMFPQIKDWFLALKRELHESIDIVEIKFLKL